MDFCTPNCVKLRQIAMNMRAESSISPCIDSAVIAALDFSESWKTATLGG
jgi:hypothetical protein